jgi:hypothetical protein
MNEEEHALCALVADAYCLDPEVLLGACRLSEVVEARWLLMALLYRRGESIAAIGRVLGKNHSTIRHGLARAGVRPGTPSQRWHGVAGRAEVLDEVRALEREQAG